MGECGAGENDFLLTYSTLKEEIVKEFNGRTERINTLLFPYLNQIINESEVEEIDLPFKFRGGLVGYLGYELKKETVKATVYQSPFPDAIFFFITRFLAFDHLKGELYIVALVRENEAESVDFWIEDIAKKIEEKKVENEEKNKLLEWIDENAYRVNLLKQPFTDEQYQRLVEDYHKDFIVELLLEMHNWQPLLQKCIVADTTFRSWANRNDRYETWKSKKGLIMPKMNL